MKKNEAELESRIATLLLTIFPTFKEAKVLQQKYFTIKLGRHDLTVDLKNPSDYPTKAIFDVLLTIDDVNIILLELKKEGLQLNTEDVDQGISYARLLHPMPPLTIISNGQESIFYNTYTKEKLSIESVDNQYIQSLIDNSFALAMNDFKDAINVLLNKDTELFSKVINSISQQKFERLSGSVGDFKKAICPEFIIQRHIINDINEQFSNNHSLVGIIAPAFSGKTCLLFEFFQHTKSQKNHLLYIDCNDHNYSILQELANNFSQESKLNITKERIREWLLSALNDSSFYLLIDNLNMDIPDSIKSEIIELIDMFRNGSNRMLYTIDEFNYEKASKIDSRQYSTIIGEESTILYLEELNNNEYDIANKLLYEKFKIHIENGGQSTPVYRNPRNLRIIIDIYTDGNNTNPLPVGQFIKVLSVPDINHLTKISRKEIYGNAIYSFYKKITQCYFLEEEKRAANPEFTLLSTGSGAISIETFKQHFPDEFDKLMNSGSIIIREIKEDFFIIIPKMHELIARHSIELIKEEIIKFQQEEKDYVKISKRFIELTTNLPYNDIVGAGVLLELATHEHIDLFSEIIQELLKLPPTIENVADGTTVLMYFEDKGFQQVELNFGDNGSFISDFLPFPILSQLAGYPLAMENPENYNKYAFHLTMLRTLGSYKHYLLRPDTTKLEDMKSIISHDLPDGGTVVCEVQGIIEPIVQSLQKCFFEIPEEFEILCDEAMDEKNIHLLWRIYLALYPITSIADPEISNKAKSFMDKFISEFKDILPIHD